MYLHRRPGAGNLYIPAIDLLGGRTAATFQTTCSVVITRANQLFLAAHIAFHFHFTVLLCLSQIDLLFVLDMTASISSRLGGGFWPQSPEIARLGSHVERWTSVGAFHLPTTCRVLYFAFVGLGFRTQLLLLAAL